MERLLDDGTVISTLMREKEEAILLNKDFAFETNFSSDLPINLINDFKKANYKICLIYFGLTFILDSSTRVAQRYMLGGHSVPQEVIEYNFTEGIKRVRSSLSLFENLLFIDGTSDFGDIVAIHIEKSGKHQITDHPAPWFDRRTFRMVRKGIHSPRTCRQDDRDSQQGRRSLSSSCRAENQGFGRMAREARIP